MLSSIVEIIHDREHIILKTVSRAPRVGLVKAEAVETGRQVRELAIPLYILSNSPAFFCFSKSLARLRESQE